jgi:flagellar FliL protein
MLKLKTLLFAFSALVLLIALLAAGVYLKLLSIPNLKGTARPASEPALVDYAMPEQVVNLADSPSYRYLKIQVTLEFVDPSHHAGDLTGEALTQRENEYSQQLAPYAPAMNDFLITTLTKKTATDLLSAKGKEELRTELLTGLQKIVPSPTLKTIYFTDFVIQ